MNKIFLSFFVVSAVLLGVFVFAQTPFNSVIVNANSCVETDGGLSYSVPGSATGSFWWTVGNATNSTQGFNGTVGDVCMNNNTLVESFCGSSISSSYSNLAGIVYVNCNNGCVNGACLNNSGGTGNNNTNGTGSNSTCTDSDGGNNLIVQGTTQGWTSGVYYNHTDYCVTGTGYGNARIAEGYCSSSNSVVIMQQTCPVNNICQSGRCVTNNTNSTLRADLIISNLTYTYVANGTVTYNSTNFTSYRVFVSAGIRNIGTGAAGASSTRMMFSGVNWPNAISTQSFSTPALSAGQSTVVSGTLTGLSGFNRLQADADSASVIVESNESNNVRVVNATLP